ncbi:MAG: hypothetical protein K6356_10615 [Chloroflexus sp.]
MAKFIRVLIAVLLLTTSLPVAESVAAAANAPAGYNLVATNTTFELYVNRETLAFKVRDRRSGYLWSSNLDEVTPDDRLNRTWTAFARSGISIEYMDSRANTRRASITNTAHRLEITQVVDGFRGQVTFTEPAITVIVQVTLTPHGVRVEVPFNGISEAGNFRLAQLHLYPFFGATRAAETPGYMLIPDGSGSLIAFTERTNARAMFYGRYYGPDAGMRGELPVNPDSRPTYPLSAPVFGITHGENLHAVLVILEHGSAFAELLAHPAGIITKFNFLYHLFIYNESYFQPTNRAGAGVTVIQPQTNAFDIVQHYHFLTGADADYVGLAHAYQRFLVEQGILHPLTPTHSELPLRVEFLAAERERVLFWQRVIPMTTITEMAAILATLPTRRVEVVYYGWQPQGATAPLPLGLQIESALGNRRALIELAQTVAAQGGMLNLYVDPQAGLMHEGGYTRSEVAMAINRALVGGHHRGMQQLYLNLEAVERRVTTWHTAFQAAGLSMALDGLGFRLYSDFRSDTRHNREEMLQGYRAITSKYGPFAIYRPNAYLWAATRAYYDMPLGDSGYIYTTTAVPFLPIVLAGYIPYYGPPLNFSSNLEADLLRHADYGAYPSFLLTNEITAAILKTRSNWIYTSAYSQWQDEVQRVYARLARVLGPVQGVAIVERTTPLPGVAVTEYANGKRVVVNYTSQLITLDGHTIPPREAILLETKPTGRPPSVSTRP